eukprot:84242_1
MSISDVLNPIDLDSMLLKEPTTYEKPCKNGLSARKQTIKTNMYIDTIPKSSSLENIICLDYDDTLMPTTYLLSKIQYEGNLETNKITKFSFIGNPNKNEIQAFVANLDNAGNAAFKLLKQIIFKCKPTNIKIVTNGANGWIKESLIVAGTFCKIYKQIANLLQFYNIEIFYARNKNIDMKYWKTKCYDEILVKELHYKHKNRNTQVMYNILTIGDQWFDHISIKQSFTYTIYSNFITHHQIKFFSAPDCRYLAIELNYVCNLLKTDTLFDNHVNHNMN